MPVTHDSSFYFGERKSSQLYSLLNRNNTDVGDALWGPLFRQLVLTIGGGLACLANRFPRTLWAAKSHLGWFLSSVASPREERLMDHLMGMVVITFGRR